MNISFAKGEKIKLHKNTAEINYNAAQNHFQYDFVNLCAG